ncbi:MAG: DinB family protein [Bacteroidia bacterium]
MIKITRPDENEYPEYFGSYISKISGDDLFKIFDDAHGQMTRVVVSLPEEKLNYRYAEGKWSIKEIIGHLIDTERVMSYRALRFARFDNTPLMGFEENDWAKVSNASARIFDDLIDEFNLVRASTIMLFKSFDEKMISSSGEANKKQMSVRAIGYMIAGHELHHLSVIKERYL